MKRINFQNEETGGTPLNATNLNLIQDNVENEFQVNKTIISGQTLQEGTPSPTNVVSIKNVNVYGVNEFDEEIELGSLSTNDGTLLSSTECVRTKNYQKVKSNATYVIYNNKDYAISLLAYDENKNFISILNVSNGIFTTTTNTKYLKWRTSASSSQNDLTVKFKLEEGTKTQYTPYSYGFLDLNLQKDTDTKTVTLISKRLHEDDYINENGFYYNKRTLILNGTETFLLHSNTTNNIYTYYIAISDMIKTIEQKAIVSHFNFKSNCWNTTDKNEGQFAINNGSIYLNSSLTTVDKFKAMLAEEYANGTPVTIEYKLATQENEKFDETNQIAWNTLENLLINGYTFINSSSNELQPTITLTEHTANEIYRENVEKFKELDNKVEKNIITTTITSQYALISTNAEKLTLSSSEAIKVGNNLNVVDGDIVIGAGINYIDISAQVYFYDKLTSGKKTIQIQKNGSIIGTIAQNLTSTYSGFSVMERLYEVQEGDKISLYVKGAKDDTVFHGITATYITAEAVA